MRRSNSETSMFALGIARAVVWRASLLGGLASVVLIVVTDSARADVLTMPAGQKSLELVTVGDPGNAGELSGDSVDDDGSCGPDRICGAVGYEYKISKYEVTAAQYAEFLNAVAKIDVHGLYDTNMWNKVDGCKIQRLGAFGSYSYVVAPDYANRPVNCVGFWDACRFANWLHNGQPAGMQGPGTTETGAYTLTTDGVNNNTIVRNADWKWAIPSEDEWYKAAFYKGGGVNAGYWDIPTSSDTYPGRDLADPFGNNANYYLGEGTYPIDSGIYTTTVGEFQNSPSPYGTFDQAGNVWEWTEEIFSDGTRALRGSSYHPSSGNLFASNRYGNADLNYRLGDVGFRVVNVPEPSGIALLLAGAVGSLIFGGWRRANSARPRECGRSSIPTSGVV